MPGVAIKLCGLSTEQAVLAAGNAKVEYVGFIHFPSSPRHVPFERAAALKRLLPGGVQTVCVLVDPNDATLDAMWQTLRPDYMQLHGGEPPHRLREIKQNFPNLRRIKAIAVRDEQDVISAASYADCADMLLFDAKPPAEALPGGNGLAFDWSLLKNKRFALPWGLSGGLTAQNVSEAIRQTDATMVDVSSGIESAPGIKDMALMHAFIETVRAL